MNQYTLGRSIAVVARLWRGELDRRLQPHSLSQARYALLTLLAEAKGPIAQNDLAERAGIAGPTLVRQIDQLEKNGLVKRRDAPGDRRVKHVCVTPAGREAHKTARMIAEELRQEAAAGMPPEDLAQLNKTLATLIKRLEMIRIPDGTK